MRWQPKRRRGKSGGCTERVTAASIPLPRRRVGCSIRFLTTTAMFATARPTQAIGLVSISTLRDASTCGHSRNLTCRAMADFYICGPSDFMSDLTAGLAGLGVARDSDPHRAVRRRAVRLRRALQPRRGGSRIRRQGPPARDRWFRSPEAVSMSAGGHRSRACSSWPRLATCPCGWRVEPASATPARAGLWPGLSAIGRTRSMHRPRAMC